MTVPAGLPWAATLFLGQAVAVFAWRRQRGLGLSGALAALRLVIAWTVPWSLWLWAARACAPARGAGGDLLAIAACAATAGAATAHRRKMLPHGTLLAASILMAELAGLALLCSGGAGAGMAAPRTLAFAAPVCWLAATFAGSLQQLAQDRPLLAHTPLALAIARRLLLSRGAQVVSTVSRIAVLGVSLGVWLVLVAMGILGGFERDLSEKVVGAGAHLTLSRAGGLPLSGNESLLAAVSPDLLVGVAARARYIDAELAVASGSNYAGVQLLGIEPAAGADTLALLSKLSAAQRRALAGPCAPHCPLVLGVELARSLGVQAGDLVRVISPMDEVLTPVGPVPRSLGGRVVGLLHSKVYEVDARLVLSDLRIARRLLGWQGDEVSGLQVRVQRPDEVEHVAQTAHQALARVTGLGPQALLAVSWKTRNQTLFAALELERVVAAVVLTFIILVASFSIVNTLSMSVLARRHEIAMLKAMGATDATVLQIFLGQGMLIGGIGTAVGAGMGVATLAALRRWGFGIPYEVYYIDALPVDIAWADVVGVIMAALLILWNFAVVPSSQAAALRPAEGLRDG